MAAMSAKLLVVEDERDIRDMLIFALEEAGFQVAEASTAERALSLLAEGYKPDLLLVDWMLAWMADTVGSALKSPWQAPQVADAAYGMWLVGMAGPPKATVLPWHCAQSPVAGWALSANEKPAATVWGRVWKPV